MFKTFCKTAALLSMALLYGCASPSMEKMQAEVSQYTLPKPAVADKGLIYVVRPSNAGMMVRFNVFLDDKEAESEMGYNRGNQYIYFYVSPGQHVISSKAENWADLPVSIKAGEVVYLKQEVEVGVVMARNGLKQLSDVEGRYLVKDAGLGTVVKESR
ncbi:hypothetical protein BV360_00906 [Pseudomonas syringae pv. actinidiae]|uniref:Lipoprotein n=8 Tax=Pseudomonas syringae group TaxID=136849 RepID=A0A656JTT3_PSESF|nr:lipoprotein [Pseudomonas syringae pv. actinidiae ICMP 18884]AOE56405.1 hypothetical protein NZ708_10525 [Pseudomonas syringae pv. actinidiae ICMP 18708]APP97367.1 hypothetical protein PsaNZ45_11080 [Pseudomonas syringae pv. actinidiae]AQL38349.1 hypothetical protein JN853_19185 [Pseudomonas syringae pv. actinidiae ICMP 9853]AYL80543.1 DUF2846 domain-containing protein [Pseudomonas syringae pv. actinidiae str. Shaanxi_M228]EPM60139.1 lipoprotein [Pseudomonas syringae pv. actinidiae ICMP 1907